MAKTEKAFDAQLEKLANEATGKPKKTKKEKEMKTLKENSTLKTIVTVIITLVAVASLAGMFYLGMNYQKGLEADKSAAVANAVASKEQTVEQ